VPAVHLKPTFFAEWLLNLAPMIREGHMPVPFSNTGRHAPVAAEDQARLIVGILREPERHIGKTYLLFGPVELTQTEIAAIVGEVIGKQVKYEQVSAEKFVELRARRGNQPLQNTAASAYSDPGALTIGAGNSYVIQHLKEVAIDHQNGIFAGTNNYIAEIGGHQPMTVEEFVTRNRGAFV
jgi:NAD(P)H dehydrogenase (quinone)